MTLPDLPVSPRENTLWGEHCAGTSHVPDHEQDTQGGQLIVWACRSCALQLNMFVSCTAICHILNFSSYKGHSHFSGSYIYHGGMYWARACESTDTQTEACLGPCTYERLGHYAAAVLVTDCRDAGVRAVCIFRSQSVFAS